MEETPKPKSAIRQTAYHVSIQDILLGEYVKEEGWTPNYILVNGNKVNRVNIIGTIVNINDNTQTQITLDDGEASIQLRNFENPEAFKEFQIGDTVLVVGKPRVFNEEKYIGVEIIKKTDPLWMKTRSKNTIPEKSEPIRDEEVIVEDVVVEDNFVKLLAKIRKLDQGQGVEFQKLVSLGFNENNINKMLENGEIFEISPGKLKILE